MSRQHIDRHVFVLSVDTTIRRSHLEIPATRECARESRGTRITRGESSFKCALKSQCFSSVARKKERIAQNRDTEDRRKWSNRRREIRDWECEFSWIHAGASIVE